MAKAVYMLCFLTSAICAALLLRGYRRSKARLLLWCALCFAGLAANNMLLYVDLVMLPTIDLSLCRALVALVAVSLLLCGLVWDAQ